MLYNETIKNEEKNEVEMKIIHEITLDVARHGIQASIPLTQHDAGMHSLLIHLRNGSREIKLIEDITATLYVSNDTYEDVLVYTENGAYPNTLECNITPYITKDTGEYTAQLQIYESGTKLFSAPEFTLIIKTDRSKDSQVLSSTPYAAVITARDAAAASAAQAAKIAEDLRKEIPVYKEYGDKTYSNALVGTVSGTSVSMDDVSPLGHKIPVTLRSKNLSYNCIYNDVAVGNTAAVIGGAVTFEKGKTYTISFDTENTGAMLSLSISTAVATTIDSRYPIADGTRKSITLTALVDYMRPQGVTIFQLANSSTANSGLCSNLQIEKGFTATKYTPYVPDGTEVTVKSCGKNILQTNVVTFPFQDPLVVFEGSITGHLYFRFLKDLINASNSTLFHVYFDGFWTRHTGSGVPQTVSSESVNGIANITLYSATDHYFNGTITRIEARAWSGASAGSKFHNIQLEVGSSWDSSIGFGTMFTDFEPYKEGETIITTPSKGAELTSISPNMTIYTDNANVIPEATYNKDTNAVINNLFAEIANLKATITDLGGTT